MSQRHHAPRERIEVLHQVKFFDGLSSRHLEHIDRHLDEVNVEPGRVLTEEGERGYEAFIIADGVAEVRKGDEVIRETEFGEMIGEIGILKKNSLRTATVVAKTPMRLLVINRNEMTTLLREDKLVADRVQENLDRHLRGR